jgi:hypothetical protein
MYVHERFDQYFNEHLKIAIPEGLIELRDVETSNLVAL